MRAPVPQVLPTAMPHVPPQPATVSASAPPAPSLARALLLWALLLAGALGLASSALAREDSLGRVGRISQVEGKAWIYDDDENRWTDAGRNRAVTDGDRISTDHGARLQLGIGSTELRLGANTEISFEQLDDDRLVVRLQGGSLAVRVRNREVAREVEVRAGDARARPDGTGHFRIDREDGTISFSAWRGRLRVDTRDQRVEVDAGRSIELYREGRDATVVTWGGLAQDAFSDWVARDEQRDDRLAAERHVSPEMTGADDLDRYGRWERHPEYGMVWLPLRIGIDWAPYRYGRWTWHPRWGWTWVDDAPWGFATSHYGRWLSWGGRWVWSPGVYVARPVYSPALVAWLGNPGSGVSVSVGIGPTVGWIPLSPVDVYVPGFRHPPRYYDRVNQPHLRPGVPRQVPTGPISYGNQGVPNAVTVVPANVLQQRQPVAPAVVQDPDLQRRWVGRDPGRDHAGAGVAPPAPPRLISVPGGAVAPATGGTSVPGFVQPLPGGGRPAPPPVSQAPSQPAFPGQAQPGFNAPAQPGFTANGRVTAPERQVQPDAAPNPVNATAGPARRERGEAPPPPRSTPVEPGRQNWQSRPPVQTAPMPGPVTVAPNAAPPTRAAPSAEAPREGGRPRDKEVPRENARERSERN